MKKAIKKISVIMSVMAVMCFAGFAYACSCNGESGNGGGITLNKTSVSLQVGETETLTASLENAEWKSSDESVATVTGGVVTAVKAGETVISAEKDGKKATCNVTVEEALIPAVNFYITPEKTAIYKTRFVNISAIMYYGEELVNLSDTTVTWSSSDERIVTVDGNGRINGVETGKATVSASVIWNGKTYSDSAEIEVKVFTVLIPAEESIYMASNTTLAGNANANNTATFDFTAYDENEQVITVDKSLVTYSSSDENVVSVDGNGIITAGAVGSAVVTAKYSDETCSTVVNVGTAISAKDDMDALGNAAKAGNSNLWGANNYYVLTNDIDYGGQAITPVAAMGFGSTWNASYGNLNPNDVPFAATFDGNGHAIKNALICNIISSADGQFPGSCVFGKLTGTVKNLCFDGIKFEKENNAYVSHSGIICENNGRVENVLVLNASVNSSCASSFGAWNNSAILVAQNGGTVRNCIVSANYTTDVADRGLTSIVYGTNTGTIENVYAINTSNQSWCKYSPNGDDDKKYASAAALNGAHPEMFADTAFTFNAESGTITLK